MEREFILIAHHALLHKVLSQLVDSVVIRHFHSCGSRIIFVYVCALLVYVSTLVHVSKFL